MGRRRGRRRGAEGEAGHGKPWRAAVPWSCGPGELGGLDSLAEAAAGNMGAMLMERRWDLAWAGRRKATAREEPGAGEAELLPDGAMAAA